MTMFTHVSSLLILYQQMLEPMVLIFLEVSLDVTPPHTPPPFLKDVYESYHPLMCIGRLSFVSDMPMKSMVSCLVTHSRINVFFSLAEHPLTFTKTTLSDYFYSWRGLNGIMFILATLRFSYFFLVLKAISKDSPEDITFRSMKARLPMLDLDLEGSLFFLLISH